MLAIDGGINIKDMPSINAINVEKLEKDIN